MLMTQSYGASPVKEDKVIREWEEVKDLRKKWNEIKQTGNVMSSSKCMISSAVNEGRGGSSGVINWSQVGCVPLSQHKHQRMTFSVRALHGRVYQFKYLCHCTTIHKTLPKTVPETLLFHVKKKNLHSCREKSS